MAEATIIVSVAGWVLAPIIKDLMKDAAAADVVVVAVVDDLYFGMASNIEISIIIMHI